MTEEDRTEQHEPTPLETADLIADTLGETGEDQRKQILHLVWLLGRTQAREILQQTLDLEAQGGMLVPNGSRRRTPGGVYFYLAYTTGVPKPGKTLKRPQAKKPISQPAQKAEKQQPEPVVTFNWEDRLTVMQEAETQKGTANVKITLVGRPGKIVDQGQCIVIVMESSKVPSLPKGVPTPPTTPTKYTVYIASKQWKKVAEAITDPEDVLIVEGFPTMDAQTSSIAVFATNATTKKLQMAQKAKTQEATA